MPANDSALPMIIDGLVISRWSRGVFEAMHRGGLTVANCTCSVWEGPYETMLNIAGWKRWFDEHGDLIMPVKTTADIAAARASGRVGIVLGWQNTSAIADRIDLLAVYKELGVGVVQLTYNTQNLVGSGCWESNDSGLSGFGREVVAEMNRVGILVDLSHVGARTAADAIAFSAKPCAYTHICPAGLYSHPRNKSDEQLRAMVERGGFVGVATYPPFLPRQAETTVDDCLDAFDYVLNLCGEASVGIGTDFTQDQDAGFFDWLRRDKGYARRVIQGGGTAPLPIGLETLADYPNLLRAMERRGWRTGRIEAVAGGNWLRFLGDVWGA
mgnify:CR=1 FL=1